MALEQLAYGYLARKRWEAEVQAAAVAGLFGGSAALSGQSSAGNGGYGERVPAETLLAEFGVTVG